MFSKIDVKFLKYIRDAFAQLTGLFITFIDSDGNFIIPEVGKRDFCSYIKKIKLNKNCNESNTYWVKKAIKTKKPYIYTCPFGLTEIVVPLFVGKKCIGAALTGQVRTNKNYFSFPFSYEINSDKYIYLRNKYQRVPLLSSQKISAAKEFINHMINYIFKIDFEALSSKFGNSKEFNKFNRMIVKNIKEYIEKNLSDKKITLSSISEYFKLPPYYLSHAFKEATGHSIAHYIVLQRLKRSVELLKNPNVTIKQIVSTCGFYDEYYFNKLFKKEYGVSPGNFRKNLMK